MDVANKLKEVGVFLANDRFVAVLEKMAGAIVPLVEGNGIACQQTAHERGKAGRTAAEKQMEVVGDEGPGIYARSRGFYEIADSFYKHLAIPVVLEDRTALYTSNRHMVKAAFDIKTWLARHTPFTLPPLHFLFQRASLRGGPLLQHSRN